MNKEEKSARRARLIKAAAIPLAGFAIFNGLALMFGLFEALGDQRFIAQLVLAVGGGVAMSLLIAFAWSMLMASAGAGDRDVSTAVLGGCLMLLGIALSAWFLATVIGGDEAVMAHQTEHLDTLQSHADRISQNAALDDRVVAALESAAVSVAGAAQAEAASGLISRIDRGRGEWAQALETFATTLQERAASTKNEAEQRRTRLTAFGKMLVQARLAVSKGEQDRFEDMITRAAGALNEADQVAAHTGMASLGTGLMAKEARDQIDEVVANLREVADDVRSEWQTERIPFYRPASKHVATFNHAAEIPGAWLVAVAFEGFPLLLLLIVLWRPKDPDTPDKPHEGQQKGRGDNDDTAESLRRVA